MQGILTVELDKDGIISKVSVQAKAPNGVILDEAELQTVRSKPEKPTKPKKPAGKSQPKKS